MPKLEDEISALAREFSNQLVYLLTEGLREQVLKTLAENGIVQRRVLPKNVRRLKPAKPVKTLPKNVMERGPLCLACEKHFQEYTPQNLVCPECQAKANARGVSYKKNVIDLGLRFGNSE